MSCPKCGDDTWRTYSDGQVKRGYCQHCSHETSESSKERTKIPVIRVERPRKPQQNKKR